MTVVIRSVLFLVSLKMVCPSHICCKEYILIHSLDTRHWPYMERVLGGQGSEPATALRWPPCPCWLCFLILGVGLLSLLYFELFKLCLFRILFLALGDIDIFGVNAVENFVSAVCDATSLKREFLN